LTDKQLREYPFTGSGILILNPRRAIDLKMIRILKGFAEEQGSYARQERGRGVCRF
jgi:hypothetical protein